MAGLIVFILIVIALILLTVLFAKHFFKVIAALWSVFFIFLVILAVLLYFDIKDLHAKFDTAEKVILLKEQESITTGFSIRKNDDPLFFQDIASYQQAFKEKNYARLKGNAYKLLITEKELFNDISYVDIMGYPLSREKLFVYLNDASPRRKAAKQIATENAIPEERVFQQIQQEFQTEDEFKGYLFAKLVGKSLEKEGANYVVRAYKAGQVEIYPETITFKVIDFLPQFIFDKLFEE
ncbi:hypothetical protein J4410_06260 [Candidatus Woesearchaeota archaeon]|nr:hypothetical protein [Candidatus Woesearchaeota archaeon]